jgi:hypothetical protein
MTSLVRIRPYLRLAAFVAALCALLAPATAGASVHAHAAKKKKVKAPVITRVTPMQVAIGQKLEIRGRNFRRGRNKNSVVFRRKGGKAIFVKADVGTRKLLRLTVPAKLKPQLATRNGAPVPTRFRLRVLAKKFGKRFTKLSLSPVIGPELPPTPPTPPRALASGDCDGDGITNGVETDDDGDLLDDNTELRIKTDGCKADTDGDGVTDGYEYQSALDLNDDEYQDAQSVLPYPEKRPYPNALFADATTDYDGDSLTLGDEFSLWLAYRDHSGLAPLIYSDGNQYSVYDRGPDGRRPGPLRSAALDPNRKYDEFLSWASGSGYGNVYIGGSTYDIRDFNRSGGALSSSPYPADPNYLFTEQRYFDFDYKRACRTPPSPTCGKLSDDERDEDADGLTNYDESRGRLTAGYWSGCYKDEKAFGVAYAGTSLVDPDSDGDGVRDGADDQDHDDIPNLMEMSRNSATGRSIGEGCGQDNTEDPSPDYGRVNPFNPCLPDFQSRTCSRHPGLDSGAAPFDGSPDYVVLQ